MKRKLALILTPLAIAGALLGATAATAGTADASAATPHTFFHG